MLLPGPRPLAGILTNEQTGGVARWQPPRAFPEPGGLREETSGGLSVRLSARCQVVKAGSRHLSPSDPKSVKDRMTDYDTREQLAGSRAKLSGGSAVHLSSGGSQKYLHCAGCSPALSGPTGRKREVLVFITFLLGSVIVNVEGAESWETRLEGCPARSRGSVKI